MARAFGGTIRLVGYDQSSIACEMARFCLQHSVGAEKVHEEIDERDSLGDKTWQSANVVLMNPPFTSWNDMSDGERDCVRTILGDLYHDHADKSLAFVQKAIGKLRPGDVLACVVPAPLLESRAGFRWRQAIQDDSSLSLRLVGCFRGFSYFRGAVVEPAFLVIARLPDSEKPDCSTVQVILAKDGYEDKAIRQLRRDPSGAEGDSRDWSVFEADGSEFTPASWLVRSRESSARLRALTEKGFPHVLDLFRVKLGIRTGCNDALILKKQQLVRLKLSSDQQEWFRPAAGNATIRSGRLLETQYVFYPYTDSGERAFANEQTLKETLPTYYDEVLLVHKEDCSRERAFAGGSGGSWWSHALPGSVLFIRR